jgi:cell division protein FtsB
MAGFLPKAELITATWLPEGACGMILFPLGGVPMSDLAFVAIVVVGLIFFFAIRAGNKYASTALSKVEELEAKIKDLEDLKATVNDLEYAVSKLKRSAYPRD